MDLVITCRPRKENAEVLRKAIVKEQKKRNSPSVSNTIETILLDYFKKEKR